MKTIPASIRKPFRTNTHLSYAPCSCAPIVTTAISIILQKLWFSPLIYAVVTLNPSFLKETSAINE